ncbi:LysR family transcriptional regulator [Undibacterium sp. KW1]|uniref:LysR family transcriptional regulator n=1 Tax=Undibacterium sp. KW1 TaxID=2058624 RepID=UPI001389745D|nr:LysR family transcriptional regulator [Undibacterium sp. KW1]
MHLDLRKLDLNLLLVFNALYQQRSVTAAAHELALSPSALSHALARLRTALGDELFVRLDNQMQPTLRADQIAEPISTALAQLSAGLSLRQRFDPATSQRNFVISASDYTAFAILPRLISRLQQVAPNITLRIINTSQKIAIAELAAGHIDFALGYDEERSPLPAGLEEFDWLQDDYVAIARQHHPHIKRKLTLKTYLQARHVVVTPWNESRGVIDYVLDGMALQRQVTVQLPNVLVAPFIIASSDLIMTLPRNAANTLAQAAGIAIYPAPFAIPPYTLKVYSHSKYARSDAHLWLRGVMMEVAEN